MVVETYMNLSFPRNTCLWKLSGTETFRLSSTAILKKWGTNLTNIEKEARRLYWADPGKLLCQVDQSGAEALVVAYEAPRGKFRDLFLYGVKPHVFVAMNVFLETWGTKMKDIDLSKFTSSSIKELRTVPGWSELDTLIKASDNWGPQERYYYIAKMICHAANYGMRAGAFQLNVLEKSRGKIALSKQQAEKYLSDYHVLFPEIQLWHRQVERQLKETGILYNLQGYPRQFTGEINEWMFKEAYAFVGQSTVGCITHREITWEQQFIEISTRTNTVHRVPKHHIIVTEALDTYGCVGGDWDILGNCHDSSLTQAPEDKISECAKVKMLFMQQTLTSSSGEKFTMKSEAAAGRNWSPFKKNKNEDGLREVKL